MSEVTKRVQKITEDQHYVPRFYMKQFSNVVNMGKKNEKAFHQNPGDNLVCLLPGSPGISDFYLAVLYQ